MLPEEITEILLNHQAGNERLLHEINLSISTIRCALHDIDENISKDGGSLAVEESEILHKYMGSIQFVGEWKPTFDDDDIDI